MKKIVTSYIQHTILICLIIWLGLFIKGCLSFEFIYRHIFIILATYFYTCGTLSSLLNLLTWGGKGKAENVNKTLLTVYYSLGTLFTILDL